MNVGTCHKLFIDRSFMKLKMGINCFVSSSMRENPVEVGGEETILKIDRLLGDISDIKSSEVIRCKYHVTKQEQQTLLVDIRFF